MLAVMFLIPDARQHPIIIAALFVLAPSVVLGSIWGLLKKAESLIKKEMRRFSLNYS
jgi:hypothetical protein